MRQHKMRRNVVVTGMDAVTALGPDLAAFEAGLRAGRTGIRPLTVFDPTGFRSQLCGQAEEPAFPDLALPSRTSRPDRFGVRAALSALRDAGLDRAAVAPAAVAMGTGTGGALHTEDYLIERNTGASPSAGALIPHQPAAV